MDCNRQLNFGESDAIEQYRKNCAYYEEQINRFLQRAIMMTVKKGVSMGSATLSSSGGKFWIKVGLELFEASLCRVVSDYVHDKTVLNIGFITEELPDVESFNFDIEIPNTFIVFEEDYYYIGNRIAIFIHNNRIICAALPSKIIICLPLNASNSMIADPVLEILNTIEKSETIMHGCNGTVVLKKGSIKGNVIVDQFGYSHLIESVVHVSNDINSAKFCINGVMFDFVREELPLMKYYEN